MARYKHPRSQRCQVSLKAKYRARGARHHEGVVYNLGEEGIFLCTEKPLGAGTDFRITGCIKPIYRRSKPFIRSILGKSWEKH